MNEKEARQVLEVMIRESHCDECYDKAVSDFLKYFPEYKPLTESIRKDYWKIKIAKYINQEVK